MTRITPSISSESKRSSTVFDANEVLKISIGTVVMEFGCFEDDSEVTLLEDDG